ncbi:hypothetical protein MDG893_01820 [Marinobacter algicola DG893]|uniref:Uncharacterized protein n=1 Tax=Marinobacter algicola DG893 TaxID=443152 RepID=A6F452_9GAMM|nr:hypothetical protein MDG893_01820 [Marinobacter algicola DG893]
MKGVNHRGLQSAVFNPIDVFTGPGVHLQHFTNGNKQRHVDNGTCGKGRRLGATLGGVAFHTRIRVHHFQLDKVGRGDGQGRAVIERHRVDILLFQPFKGITNRLGIRRELLERPIGFHEVPEFAIGVQVLHFLIDHVSSFQALSRLESALPLTVGHQVTQFYPVECLPFTGLYEFVLENDAGVAIQQNLKTATEFVGRI